MAIILSTRDCNAGERPNPGSGNGKLSSVEEFPVLATEAWKLIIHHGEGCSSGVSAHRKAQAIRAEDYISLGMFRIVKCEELEWRKQQSEEIKAMLFKSPKLRCVQEALEDIQSMLGDADCRDHDSDLEELNAAMNNLDVALSQMEKLGKWEVYDHGVSGDGQVWAVSPPNARSCLQPLETQAARPVCLDQQDIHCRQ
jgi:hypothetical protein